MRVCFFGVGGSSPVQVGAPNEQMDSSYAYHLVACKGWLKVIMLVKRE